MSKSYTDLYEVLDVFEDNAYQKIMMGSPYNNPEEIVIINNLKRNNPLAEKIFESAKFTLKNVLHSEVMADSLVLVTEYEEGLPVKEYLKSIKDDNIRYNLAKNYLRNIAIYETFSTYMQTIFVDQNQIIVRNNKLVMNGLMILDEQINVNLPFAATREKIYEALQTIFYEGKPKFDENEQKRIDAFFKSLSPKSNDYNSISDIIKGFEKAFVRSNDHLQPTPVPTPTATDEHTKNATPDKKAETPNDINATNTENDTELTLENHQNIKAINNTKESNSISNSKNKSADLSPVSKEAKQQNISESKQKSDVDNNRKKRPPVSREVRINRSAIPNRSQKKEKKRLDIMPILLLLVLVALLGGVLFMAYNHFFMKKTDLLPQASFDRTVQDDKQFFKNTSVAYGEDNELVESQWTVYSISTDGTQRELKTYNKTDLNLFIKTPGTYKTELRVKDSKNNWSEVASEEFELGSNNFDGNQTSNDKFNAENSNNQSDVVTPVPPVIEKTENLNNLNISYDSDNVSSENDLYRNGSGSIKFDLNNSAGTITLNNTKIKAGSILSGWILGDNTDPIVIKVVGYSDNTKLFTNVQKHILKSTNTWEMFDMKLSKKSADKLVITLSGNGLVWMDDLDFSAYK